MRLPPAPLGLAIALVTAPATAAQGPGDLESIPWVGGPVTGQLGPEASVQVPAGCNFTGKDGVRQFMELTQNPVGGDERGVILCGHPSDPGAPFWFVVFTFEESGYVKDDERDQLDAGAILESIRRGTEASNEERRRRGWSTLTIEGWVTEPYYDVTTHNLTWAINGLDSDGSRSVNHSVRLLGRSGVMHVDLVAAPEDLSGVMGTFGQIVAGHQYLPGHRYAEWRAGDKVATYGLTALVAGGAGAIAAKTGLLAKFWKLIVAFFVVVGAGIKALWSRITGRGSANTPA